MSIGIDHRSDLELHGLDGIRIVKPDAGDLDVQGILRAAPFTTKRDTFIFGVAFKAYVVFKIVEPL